jgi:signal transduction histidine kinase
VEVNKFEGIPYIHTILGKREAPEIFAKLPAPTEEDSTKIKLKYISPSDFHTVAAENLVRGPENAGLDGRTVFIGYTAYRKFTFNHREATRANTPWEVDGGDLESGMPVVLIHAITFANLLNESWISSAPQIWNLLQTVLVSLFSLWIWSLSAGFASFLFIGGWSLIIVIHAGSFAFFSFYVPLADTMLFSSVATISGALWRLRTEARVHAIQEAQMSSQRELAKMQERFLNRFSVQLAKINKNIKAALERQGQLREGTGTIQQAYTKALGSCEELDDYLQGIQQFSSIDGSRQFQVRNQDFPLQPILNKVLAQFESRKKESQVVVKIDGDQSLRAHGDPTLTGQIVFNLISNAIKYSPPNSEIEIKFELIGSMINISVCDSGPGIPEEFRDRIFEKFYRVKDDYVYKVKGHGLGLYLSRYFSELMNAKLSLVPSEKGAKFSLELRAATT